MADIATKDELNAALELQRLRLSVRFRPMLGADLSVMTALIDVSIGLHQPGQLPAAAAVIPYRAATGARSTGKRRLSTRLRARSPLSLLPKLAQG